MKFRFLMKTVALCGFATCMWLMGAAAAGLDTWNVQSVPPSFPHGTGAILGIDYGNGIYVAVGLVWADNLGYVLRSTDNGVSWKEVSNPTGNLANPLPQLSGVAFHGNSFVAVGQSGKSWTSPDGLLWTPHEVYPGYTGVLHSLRFLNNQFVALPWGANIATSPDGITWTFFPSPPNFNSQSSFADVTYGLGKYVLANPGNSYTTDGVNLLSGVGDAGGGNAVAFGMVNGTTPLFISLYAQNYVISSDGVNWKNPSTPTTSPPFTTSPFNNELPITALTFSPEANTFVAGGPHITSGAFVYWTTDGITWGSGFIPNASGIWNIRYVNGSFFATGDNFTIAQSGPIPGVTGPPSNIGTPVDFHELNNNRLSQSFSNFGQPLLIGSNPPSTVQSIKFKTLENQSLHVSVSEGLPPENGVVRLELYDSSGMLLSPLATPNTLNNGTAIVYDSPIEPTGTYYVAVRAIGPSQNTYSPKITVSGGDNWKVISESSSTKAHHIGIYSVPLNATNTPRIQTVPTWVFIHGRASSPGQMDNLPAGLISLRGRPQVLAVDWEPAAADNDGRVPLPGVSGQWPFLAGKRWIKQVGDFAASQLIPKIGGFNLNVIGHSWGSYVAQQLGRDYLAVTPMGKMNALIALDPALVGAEVTDDAQGHISSSLGLTIWGGLSNPLVNDYFARVAHTSWAFYSSPFGNYPNVLTANNRFVLLNGYTVFNLYTTVFVFNNALNSLLNATAQAVTVSSHGAAVTAFARMLAHNNGPVQTGAAYQISARFAVIPFSTWRPNQVRCIVGTDRFGLVAVRKPWETGGDFVRFYPLEGVLRVDLNSEPIEVWP